MKEQEDTPWRHQQHQQPPVHVCDTDTRPADWDYNNSWLCGVQDWRTPQGLPTLLYYRYSSLDCNNKHRLRSTLKWSTLNYLRIYFAFSLWNQDFYDVHFIFCWTRKQSQFSMFETHWLLRHFIYLKYLDDYDQILTTM